MKIPFCGPTYNGRSTAVDSSRCINFFPELGLGNELKSEPILVGTPGTKTLFTFSSGEVRMLYVVANRLFTVVGSFLYELFSDGTKSAKKAAFPDTSGEIIAADNGISANGVIGGNQILMLSNKRGYVYDVTTEILTEITDYPSFPAQPTGVTYQDGYFIVTNDSMTFRVSNLFDGLIWNANAFFAVWSTPDNVQVPVSLNQQLYMIKNQSTEVFYNSGSDVTQGSPFIRVSGGVFPFGTPAPRSVAYGLSTVFFLANQGYGGTASLVGVAMLDGYTPSIISTPAINYRIKQMKNVTDARGYIYIDEGHAFYVLTFPSDDMTFVYDLSTKMWHERSTSNLTDDFTHRHLSQHYAYFHNMHIVADYRSPKILTMSSNYYDDDGVPITSIRISPIIHNPTSSDSILIHRLVVDIESGVGLDSVESVDRFRWVADGTHYTNEDLNTAGHGTKPDHNSKPTALLSWSNDNCNTWSNEYSASIGERGQSGYRLIWKRLGHARNRVFKLKMSDATKKIIVGAYINEGAL